MKQIITAKLKLLPTPEQFQALRQTQLAYRDALTAVFHPGKRVRPRANHSARLRKRLQQKGTRGAIRRLKRVEQRERRLRMASQSYNRQTDHGTVPTYFEWARRPHPYSRPDKA